MRTILITACSGAVEHHGPNTPTAASAATPILLDADGSPPLQEGPLDVLPPRILLHRASGSALERETVPKRGVNSRGAWRSLYCWKKGKVSARDDRATVNALRASEVGGPCCARGVPSAGAAPVWLSVVNTGAKALALCTATQQH